MPSVIWKYPLPKAPGEFELELPSEYNIISAGLDPKGLPSLWVLHDPKRPKKSVRLRLVFTGEEFNEQVEDVWHDWTYVVPCTYQYNGFVFHLLWWN